MNYNDINGTPIKNGMWLLFPGNRLGRVCLRKETPVVAFIDVTGQYDSRTLEAGGTEKARIIKTIRRNIHGNIYDVVFDIVKYVDNNNTAIEMVLLSKKGVEGNMLTVNLGITLSEEFAYIDTNNNGEDVAEWMAANGLGKATGTYRQSGFWQYPLFKLNLPEIKKHTIPWENLEELQ